MKNDLEILYDFKKVMMSTAPEILRCTLADNHGKIEQIIVEHITDITDEQWRAIFDRKYSNLFQDGMPHISWNIDRSKILCALSNAVERGSRGYERISADHWSEIWYKIRVQWIKVPCGTIIKYRREDPISWSSYSRTKYDGEVVEPDKAPKKATHCAVILAVSKFNEASIIDQYAGTQDEYEAWLVKAVSKYGNSVFVKLISLED